jgi:SPP1 gp7 family putative phage head morphogenesis protein
MASIKDLFSGLGIGQSKEREEVTPKSMKLIGETPVKVIEVGTSGTESYSGYIDEEYLADLKGKDAATKYDQMRRSDPKVVMCIKSVCNPIKSASWSIEKLEDSPEADKQYYITQKALFENEAKTFDEFIGEILTMVAFGYSLFEITHKVVLKDPEIGSYNSFKSVKWLSQKTIEQWITNHDGTLRNIIQEAYGDNGRLVEIPSEFLLHFAIDKEGDNYEGISMLRSCYGAYLRKLMALKQEAIGNQNNAIPIPVVKCDDGEQSSSSYRRAREMLTKYVKGQVSFLMLPKDWDIEMVENKFDPQKLRVTVESENNEMVQAFLANFLQLGQNGSGGSYALGSDLSDFFLSSLEFISKMICDKLNKSLVQQLVDLNFEDGIRRVKIVCTGINDKAGTELANILSSLSGANIITPDERLETDIRRRLKLPEREKETERKKPDPASPYNFAEKKSKKPPVLIEDASSELKEVFSKNLKQFAEQVISKTMAQYEALGDGAKYQAPNKVNVTGLPAYIAELSEVYSRHTLQANQSANQELKRSVKLASIDKLTRAQRSRIKAKAELIANTQIADIEKASSLQYQNSVSSSSDPKVIQKDLTDSVDKLLSASYFQVGADITASQLVNEGRQEIFDEAEEQIESYTFQNADPVSAICQELNGMTFAYNDPAVQKYQPPLHHNCKSYWVVNLKGDKGNPDISSTLALSKKAQESITLGEPCCKG